MNWTNIEPQVEKLQQQIVSTMKGIKDLSNGNDKLPDVPGTFTPAQEMIENPCYNVVVCGEVKKGKSSFLNAIIGQEILPVNNEIATSQVFRITNSEQESFSLVFTDGSTHPITRDELSRYGSQIDADLYGEPIFKDKTLDYIQVNVPVKFLPKGVSLVDTPGLGALYKSHELITQNYISKASAVIFVTDPERPLVSKEKEFIQKVMGITSNVLFVMTKIDTFSEDACNDILIRNKEELALIYSEKNLDAPNIYPVSSKSLQNASRLPIEKLRESNLKNSKFLEVKEQLLYMIYKGVGLLRTGLALKEAANQASKIKTIVEELLQTALSDNQQEQAKLAARKVELQNKLQTEWGEGSAKRKQILEEIYSVCNSAVSRAQQIVSTSGSVFSSYESRINALTNMEEARNLAQTLPQDVVNDVKAQWEHVASDIQDKVIVLISQVGAEMGAVAYGNISHSTDGIDVRELTFKERLSCYRNQFFTSSWATRLGGGLLVSLGIASLPILAPIAGAIAAVWGFLSGREDTKEKELTQNKNNFLKELQKLMGKLSVELLHAPENGSKSKSMVQEFIDGLKKSAEEAIQNIFQKQKDEMKKQLDDLTEQAKLSAEEKRKEITRWSDTKNQLECFILELKEEVTLRNEIAKQMGLR